MLIAKEAANIVSTPRLKAGPTMSKEARFWDRIAPKYARKPIEDVAAYEHKLKVTREYLRPDMELLEIGCGTGGTALRHAKHVARIRATDIADGMLDIARAKARDAGIANVDFECASVEDIAAPDAAYGGVLALSILHLLRDPEAAMARVRRWLKPGGVFVSSTACIGEMNPLLRAALPVGRAVGVFPYVNIFTQQELKTMMRNAGFIIDYEWRPAPGKAVFIVARKS